MANAYRGSLDFAAKSAGSGGVFFRRKVGCRSITESIRKCGVLSRCAHVLTSIVADQTGIPSFK